MSGPVVILCPPPYLVGGVQVHEALRHIRDRIADGGARYICLEAEFMYSFGLREWLCGILRIAGIRTDGAGFLVENCPDWLLEVNDEDSPQGARCRRVYVLGRIINALQLTHAQASQT